MTEAEKRRIELLGQARRLSRSPIGIPAVHPRYRAIYNNLYETGGEAGSGTKGTFFIRTVISVLLFAVFVVADHKQTAYGAIDSEKVMEEIVLQPEFPGDIILQKLEKLNNL